MTDNVDNWANEDKLDRKTSADFLTNFLTKRYSIASKHGRADTFVLNIRADWGFGKTFFLDRWAKDLKQLDYPVVCFNAWENDFCDDPLIGFIAEINTGLSNRFKEVPAVERHLDQALAVGRKLIKPVSIGIASILAKRLSGCTLEELKGIFSHEDENDEGGGEPDDKISSLISKYAEVALKEHLSKKEAIGIFKKRLAKLIVVLEKEAGVQLPMFVFIDELDRCRPTYAIELLEAIKHLFGVPGIYFVVATNLEQLGHSIRAVYGEQFDSERYLKRFFDQEYLLPLPDSTLFTSFLFEKYSLNDFGTFYTVIEDGIYDIPTDQALFSILSENFSLSLRDQEQVAGALQAILSNWPEGERIHLAYLLFLIIAKQRLTSLFQQLAENQFENFSKFADALAPVLRPNSKFKTFESSNDQHGRIIKAEYGTLDLLWKYQTLCGSSLMELRKMELNDNNFPEKINCAVYDDAPKNWPSGTNPVLHISNYSHRVSQAGQLTIPKRA